MSWLLGAVDASHDVCENARGLVRQTPSLFIARPSDRSILLADGPDETCHCSNTASDSSGWIAAGLGFNQSEAGLQLIGNETWHKLLTASPAKRQRVDGHFAAVSWQRNDLSVYTDSLGLRTLYYVALPRGGFVFSTRLEWLCWLTGKSQIDFHAFGAQWLAFNQIDTSSPVQGIHRLGPGGHLQYQAGKLSVTETPWTPTWKTTTAETFQQRLEALVNPSLHGSRTISLGLSGGLDSRLLLALSSRPNTKVHTFGDPLHPDGRIASRIADALSLNHVFYDQPLRDASALLTSLRHHISHTQPMVPASAIPGLQHYSHMYDQGCAVIDGGWGELARRQFLNRLRIKGKAKLLTGAFETASTFILTPRPRIFNPDCHRIMHQGVVSQFAETWQALPAIDSIGFENALDLFSVRTRLPNFFGFEQSRLDGQGINYMPFAQASLLDIIFGLPVGLRKNAKLFREIIRKKQPVLTRFQLVKGDQYYPYVLNPAAAYLWTKLKSTKRSADAASKKGKFLAVMRPFILDTLDTTDTRTFEGYDITHITNTVEAYFKGDESKANLVDWWLSFEIWRQAISSASSS